MHRSESHILVQDLEANTKYEFAVRLHVDQLSSPWSPVVYHSTLLEGMNYGSHLLLECIEYSHRPCKTVTALPAGCMDIE